MFNGNECVNQQESNGNEYNISNKQKKQKQKTEINLDAKLTTLY